MKNRTYKLTTLAVLTALAAVLIAITQFPIFPAAGFLKYDAGDVPLLIGAFMFGPVSGLVATVISAALQAFLMGGDGIFGFLMHTIATGTLILVSSLIYRKFHTRRGALVGLLCGCAAMTIVAIAFDLIFIPLYMGATIEVVWSLIGYIVGFNLIKSIANSLIVFLIYKPLHRILEQARAKTQAA